MWCLLFFQIVYGIFNILYVVAFHGTNVYDRPYIYKILDWLNNPGISTLFLCAIFAATPFLYSVFYFLAKFRDLLWTKYYASKEEVLVLVDGKDGAT